MPDYTALILTDNLEPGQLRAAILKQRAIRSAVVKYGPQGNGIKSLAPYDIIVIDSYADAERAKSIARQVRAESTAPIMLLTWVADVRYHLDAYSLGVDECVTQPMSELLFLAKVVAWLRHVPGPPSSEGSRALGNHEAIAYNGFRLDLQRRLVTTNEGNSVRLSDLECRLMHVFMTNHGRVLEFNQLVQNVWNYQEVEPRLLTNLVYRLRQKLASAYVKLDHIKTIERIGYMFE